MKVGPIALKIRLANTRFGNDVYGAAELDVAIGETIKKDVAFVIQTGEVSTFDYEEQGINQLVSEQFSVIVVIANDSSQADNVGFGAHELLYNTRSEILGALLGWQLPDAESEIGYLGGELLDFNRAYLWYQFNFESVFRLTPEDGVDSGESQLSEFDTLYTDFILSPSSEDNLPWTNELPVSDPNLTDSRTIVDYTNDPYGGGFFKGVSSGFDKYRLKQKLLDRKWRYVRYD